MIEVDGLGAEFFRVTDVAILTYFLVINTSYLLLILLAAAEFVRHLRHQPFAGLDEMYRSPLTPRRLRARAGAQRGGRDRRVGAGRCSRCATRSSR